MSNQPLYRWLEQQGEAFGAPGMQPRWTSSVKDAVGTAYSASSRLWFTCSHGVLNEIYHPTIDHAQVRDMEFLVSDGETFVHEEKRDLLTTFEYIHPEALGVRYINARSRRPLPAHQGNHLRSAPQRAADACAPGGEQGPGPAVEGVRPAGAAPGRRRGGQLGSRHRRGRLPHGAGVEGIVVAGHGRQLRVLPSELRLCGLQRRLEGPEG